MACPPLDLRISNTTSGEIWFAFSGKNAVMVVTPFLPGKLWVIAGFTGSSSCTHTGNPTHYPLPERDPTTRVNHCQIIAIGIHTILKKRLHDFLEAV